MPEMCENCRVLKQEGRYTIWICSREGCGNHPPTAEKIGRMLEENEWTPKGWKSRER